MDSNKELEFLGTVLKLFSKYRFLTIGQIAHRTRAMRKPRRISKEAIFPLMEKFSEGDLIKRVYTHGRVFYGARELTIEPLMISKHDLLEAGLEKTAEPNELIRSLANAALRSRGKVELPKYDYVPKEPPPTDVKGFK